MNDDDLHPPHELASAFLDDDVTDDERARVAASPQITELVQSFRDIRMALTDVAQPSASARAAALAAALDEFDSIAACDPSPTATAPVIALAGRRRWSSRIIAAAAAVLLVGVGGVVGAQLLNSGSDDKASSATVGDTDRMMDTEAAPQVADVAGYDSVPTIGAITGGADVSVIIDSADQLLGLPVPAVSESAPVVPADTLVSQNSVASKRSAVACLTENQTFLADIMFQGQSAIAARDTVSGVTQAITDDCTVLVTVGP